MNANLDEVKELFISESSEILQKMESILLFLEMNPVTDDKIHELFRSIHTIKGSAGIFGYEETVSFTHVVENLLDKVREKEIQLEKPLISLLLDCRDHISDLIEYAANGRSLEEQMRSVQNDLLVKLNSYLSNFKTTTKEKDTPAKESVTPIPLSNPNANWHISLRFKQNTFRDGLEPFSVLKYLNKDGEILNLVTLTNLIPDLENLQAEDCYTGFEIEYKSDKDMSFILQAFEFVEYDCAISILPPDRTCQDIYNFLIDPNYKTKRLLRILLEMGAMTRDELHQMNQWKRNKTSNTTLNESLPTVEDESREIQQIENIETYVENKQVKQTKESNRENKIIRIDSSKLDHLINLVGELVIGGANINQLSQKRGDPELSESAYFMNHLIGEIRETALKIRMVQIGETFNRFQRTVREIGHELGKEIQLTISGGETELDKTVVEKINDPLVHLIRNAIDHGIEPKEERVAKGKPAVGQLTLNAFHETGSIVIEVKDDGKGLNREKILNKAQEKGLVSGDKQLSDSEIFRLIFKAGFSTADKITNISGRGVGLDVVEKNIDALRGSVQVFSEQDKGTTFKVRFPLTLAIIDGFLFRVGKSFYVVPLDLVVECLEYKEEESVDGSKDYINLRGEVLPFIRLSEFFQTEEESNTRKNILVIQYAGKHAGLLIGTLHGEIQTVIKPLGKVFEKLKGISGSTILGSGEVGLIIDIPSLFKKVEEIERKFVSGRN
ncbi:MAG TPA: chemotaxis protein CheA [Leptospiraceae bacterium]|nr:chemotaxis protein CheA [Leptospiraceae bacterium]HMW05600.1 chemotaxis protein CheA [Leptospiraceae bacterium]HMX33559.1 chemotaxis protein CheA [Leptospiraceae bacterium]HMY31109.1 chemotaxis protein CheA [Leptospiraceae bacterium]HMZ63692.1 chemotaxis protein CheA [Leptospiraceae bacterium]